MTTMSVAEASAVLGIQVPFTTVALKKVYRALAHEHHPDKGGNAEAFKAIAVAYDVLQPLAGSDAAPTAEARTVQGDLLSKLGKGFPLTESARPCDDCSGHGFNTFEDHDRSSLVECDYCVDELFGLPLGRVGWTLVSCQKCGGDGKFKINGKERGVCFKCNGRGTFRKAAQQVLPCPKCHGRLRVPRKDANAPRKTYSTCSTCRGIGELKMFNPVLPRGFLAAKK